MIHKLNHDALDRVKPLFDFSQTSVLRDAVLSNKLGAAYADDPQNPHVAMLAYGDVVTFGGDPKHEAARELIKELPLEKGIFHISDAWVEAIKQVWGAVIVDITRYEFSNENLQVDHLTKLIETLPPEYSLEKIDLAVAKEILALPAPISLDHVNNFGSPERFLEIGLGYVIRHEGRIVSLASSYASSPIGIEIQVNTGNSYRGKGLAMVVSAALIRDCLLNGFSPNWDAANETSARLAERLGYTPVGKYEMLLRIPEEEL